MQPEANTTVTGKQFTSNPFIAFAKGLGAGLSNSPVAVLGISALYFVLILAVFMIGIPFIAISAFISPILLPFTFVAFVLVGILGTSILSGRGAVSLLGSLNGKTVSIKEANEQLPLKYSWNIVGYTILYGLAVGVGFLFFVVPGLILLARWGLGLFVIADEKVGPIDAIKKSWVLTAGNTWNMLGAIFTQNLILGQSLLLLGTLSATAHRYFELKGLHAKGVKNTDTHWINYLVVILFSIFLAGYFALIAVMAAVDTKYQNNDDYWNSSSSSEQFDSSSNITNDAYDTSLDLSTYCFIDGDLYTDPNAEQKCVSTKEECLANTYCEQYYGSYLE